LHCLCVFVRVTATENTEIFIRPDQVLVRFVRTADSSDGEKRLFVDLIDNAGYNKEIRPRHDPIQTVVVDLELDLNHLIQLVGQLPVS